MYNPNRVARMRSQYPPGTRILLSKMHDPYSPVPPGTMGTVDMVDDACNLLMTWDNGRTLSLIPGEDSFSIVEQKQEPVSMKLYMPLYCDLYLYNDRGSLEEYPEIINGQGALEYEDNILAAIVKYRMPEEAERGLMHWYHGDDSVKDKVLRAEFSVEERSGALWGTVECLVRGELTGKELYTLKDFLVGQAADGAGEGLEQQDIRTGDEGILNVHLWSSDNWQLMTEAEFTQRYEQTQAPQMDGMSY